jgi:Zn-dependent protease
MSDFHNSINDAGRREENMGWSFRMGRIAGIKLYVHFTFLLLLAWVAFVQYQVRQSAVDAVVGVLFILVLFGVVVLHELGHALAARRYGIPTRDITLLPIGGVARLERMPEDPRQEMIVALAGPAVNVILAGLAFGVILLGEGLAPLHGMMESVGGILYQFLFVNVGLALFNLLPAFPMDGGRVLRAVLAMRMGRNRATQVAARVGQAMAVLFGFVGLFFNPFLLLIAVFVWIGAEGEAALVRMRSDLAGISVGRVMVTNFRTLTPHEPLVQAADEVMGSLQSDFPVVENSQVAGVLTRSDLLDGLARGGQDVEVAEVMHREFPTADPAEMLDDALIRLQRDGGRSLPVVSDGHLVGLVMMDNLGEVLRMQKVLRHSREPHAV